MEKKEAPIAVSLGFVRTPAFVGERRVRVASPRCVKADFWISCPIGVRVVRSVLPDEFAGPSSTLLFLESDDDGSFAVLEISFFF